MRKALQLHYTEHTLNLFYNPICFSIQRCPIGWKGSPPPLLCVNATPAPPITPTLLSGPCVNMLSRVHDICTPYMKWVRLHGGSANVWRPTLAVSWVPQWVLGSFLPKVVVCGGYWMQEGLECVFFFKSLSITS